MCTTVHLPVKDHGGLLPPIRGFASSLHRVRLALQERWVTRPICVLQLGCPLRRVWSAEQWRRASRGGLSKKTQLGARDALQNGRASVDIKQASHYAIRARLRRHGRMQPLRCPPVVGGIGNRTSSKQVRNLLSQHIAALGASKTKKKKKKKWHWV